MAARRWGFGARAESFAAALDAAPDAAGSDAQLVALVGRLRGIPDVPATTRAASRAAVMSAAAITAAEFVRAGSAAGLHAGTQAAGATTTAAGANATGAVGVSTATTATATAVGTSASGAGFLAGLLHATAPFVIGTTAAAVAATGVGVAAHRATPGQPFYQVKKVVEQVQLDLADGSHAAAKARLGFAAARLEEIRKLAGPDPSPLAQRRISALLDQLWSNLDAATPTLLHGSVADQQALWKALNETTTTLTSLVTTLPGTLNGQLGATLNLVSNAEGQVSASLGNLLPPGSPTPGNGSGPVPAPSASAGGTPNVPAPGIDSTQPPGVIGGPVPPVTAPPLLENLPSNLGGLVGGLVGGLGPPNPTVTPTPGSGDGTGNGGPQNPVAPVTSAAGSLVCQLLHTC